MNNWKIKDTINFGELISEAQSEYRAKALKVLEMTPEQYYKKVFEIGLEIEKSNSTAKGMTKQKEYWTWLNNELDDTCFNFITYAGTVKEKDKNYKQKSFFGCVDIHIIKANSTTDLTKLIN